jgi:hypothetical protein
VSCDDIPDSTQGCDTTATHRYHVVVRRDGRGWRVHIDGIGGPAVIAARALSDVEPRVRRYIWSYTGIHPSAIEVDVEVRLPPSLQLRLDLAEQLCAEAAAEIGSAIEEFVATQFSSADVCRVLEDRWIGPRPLAITNGEILRDGLANCPDAIGIRWDDHGRFLTVTCRDCVEANRATYVDAPPDEPNILVYEGPLVCDCCHAPLVVE